MATFGYDTWSGTRRTVQCDRVIFGYTHVVFHDEQGRVVLAEKADNVHRLEQLESEGEWISQGGLADRAGKEPHP